MKRGRFSTLIFGGLLLLMATSNSCTSNTPKRLPSFEQQVYNPDLPTFDISVLPVRFVAAVPSMFHSQLCLNTSGLSQAAAHQRAVQYRGCGGVRRCVVYPDPLGKDERWDEVVVGEQNLPGYESEALTAQFVSSLSRIGNFRIVNTGPQVRQGAFSIKATLTEFNPNAAESKSGFGGIGLIPISMLFSSQSKTRVGYVRFDMEVIDNETQRIISAFPVGGTFSDKYVSETFFGGVISEKETFTSNIMDGSTRTALQNGAVRAFNALKDYSKSPAPTFGLLVDGVQLPPITLNTRYGTTCDGYNGSPEQITASAKGALLETNKFSLLDNASFKAKDLTRTVKLSPNERGPYVLRMTVTELARNVDVNKKSYGSVQFDKDDSTSESMLKAGAFIPAFWFGFLTGLPTQMSKTLEQSMVAIDVKVIDPKDKRVILSFPARGTWKAGSNQIGSKVGSGYYASEQASSVLEGAIREALKEATERLEKELGEKI